MPGGVIMLVPSAAISPIRHMPSPSTPDAIAKAVEGKQFPSPSVSVKAAKAMRRIAAISVPKDSVTTDYGTVVKAVMLTTLVVAAVII